MDAGAPILAGGAPLSLSIPAWADFGWPSNGPNRNSRGRRESATTGASRPTDVPPMPDHPKAPPRAWQRMLSGRRLDLIDPSPLDIEIDDIAHGLARVARWNGQTVGAHAFSVAQHTLLVDDIAADDRARSRRRGPACRHAARCAGICDRRHDLAVQGAARRRIHGRSRSGCSPPSIAASASETPLAGEAHGADQGGRPHRRLLRGDDACRLRRGRGARFFGQPRGIDPSTASTSRRGRRRCRKALPQALRRAHRGKQVTGWRRCALRCRSRNP